MRGSCDPSRSRDRCPSRWPSSIIPPRVRPNTARVELHATPPAAPPTSRTTRFSLIALAAGLSSLALACGMASSFATPCFQPQSTCGQSIIDPLATGVSNRSLRKAVFPPFEFSGVQVVGGSFSATARVEAGASSSTRSRRERMWTESYGVLGRLAHHLPRDLASISPPVRRPPRCCCSAPLCSLFFAVPAITFFCHSCPSRAEQGRARSASSRSSCATCPRSTTPSARPPQARDPHAPLPRGPLSESARWGF